MKKKAAPGGKGAFYRLMRDWHGYFSAFAFLALLFFALTGVLLNHPSLLPGRGVPLDETVVQLTPEEVARVRGAKEPGRELMAIVGDEVKVAGAYLADDVAGADLFTRTQGVRGVTNLRTNLETGRVEVVVGRSNMVQVMNGLHTGEITTLPWKILIDVAAITLILVALFGFVLFFSLRYRLRTALILTGVGLLIPVAIFVLLVP